MIATPQQLDWHPASWQTKVASQQPLYPDANAVAAVIARLSTLPPLVVSWEVEALQQQIARAQRGEAFLLQGGDCAENFDDCNSDQIARKLKILLQVSVVLLHSLKKPVIRVGRMAGQYAKPRSANDETRDGRTLPSYRGDLVNRNGFTLADRTPDPELMLVGYQRAALTLNFVRALAEGGFADLHHPEYWDIGFAHSTPFEKAYRQIVKSITDSMDFFEFISGQPVHRTRRIDFFTSHEGLHLLYEQAQTRFIERRGRWYNLSTHYPWIGMRTAQLDGAHIEYFRGIANPIAVKVGAGMSAEWLQGLIETLNPRDEPGRLTLIHRFGSAQIAERLPAMIEAVRAAGATVLWICDPMHGNTETTSSGIKTRSFDRILSEVEQAFSIHEEMGSYLGGVHFELTGDDVTECIGGARGLTESDLTRAYLSQVDPRLNYEQALELAMRIAELCGRRAAPAGCRPRAIRPVAIPRGGKAPRRRAPAAASDGRRRPSCGAPGDCVPRTAATPASCRGPVSETGSAGRGTRVRAAAECVAPLRAESGRQAARRRGTAPRARRHRGCLRPGPSRSSRCRGADR
jgi:3-deoxy-7-phosphoheptulonate synthase